MKYSVLGSAGQVGTELCKRQDNALQEGSVEDSEDSIEIVWPAGDSHPSLDITDHAKVREVLAEVRPDVIVNAAAYTAVDKAEEEREQAFAVNAEAPRVIAQVAKELGARLVHISTDYVFGGSGEVYQAPIPEETIPSPVNVYGESKLAGDEAVLEEYPERSVVVRTSSVHGAYGNNFVHTMLRLMEEREEIRVVQDQVMSPTWAGWLAGVLLELGQKEVTGVLHASGKGAISWYEFAVSIRELASFPEGVNPAQVVPIPSSEFPTPAKRPSYSVLDCSKVFALLPEREIDWLEGLKGHLQDLGRLKA